MNYHFSDNKTGADCWVTLVGPHAAVLTVFQGRTLLGTEEVSINYEPRFGWDVSDIATFEHVATRIIDAATTH